MKALCRRSGKIRNVLCSVRRALRNYRHQDSVRSHTLQYITICIKLLYEENPVKEFIISVLM